MGDLGHVLFAVQDSLIKVSNAPPLGYIEPESFGKLRRRLLGNGVSPCPERNEKLILLVERHIAVHHSGDTHCAVGFGDNAVLLFYIFSKSCITVLQSAGYILKGVRPHSVFVAVLPFVAACRYRHKSIVCQHCLYSGGTKFDSEIGFALFDFFLYSHVLSPFRSLPRIISYSSPNGKNPPRSL